ncbi:AmpG family muropeptide MFS transporter [Oceanibacterium hippocampi]|uniref:Muropeptide transporter n=1 Tax=Oceanibacterium hippocampi TaxID=745714 RepID=A0A1Y5RPT5_9PROT|nr:MFS transporter [Oceanibacterium hippocampi]SLN19805.1 muropeptide transporter [Oceanibacterium hippocampi]
MSEKDRPRGPDNPPPDRAVSDPARTPARPADEGPAGLAGAIALYRDPRVVAVLLLGFASGLPLALTGQTLSVWLFESGQSKVTIGLFALLGLPYVLKFLWAPLIDAIHIPFLHRRLGRRRSWLLTSQAALIGSVLMLGAADPADDLFLVALIALVVTFFSATQDLVIDAFRIEKLEAANQAGAMAHYVAAYRIALLVGTAGMYELVSILQANGFALNSAWFVGYAVMAGCLLIGVMTTLATDEPAGPEATAGTLTLGERFRQAVFDPFRDFAARDSWLLILLFITLFKFGDAFAGTMTSTFVLDIGFDKTDYGRVVKLFGFAATLIGGYAGGYLYRRLGTLQALWLAGILQMASNLMFCWQASVGADLNVLVAVIAVENLTGGFGTVIFVAYISGLCTNRLYTATQFALLSALSGVGRTVLSSTAGYFAEQLGWFLFFAVTAFAAVPGLILLWALARRQGSADEGDPSAGFVKRDR